MSRRQAALAALVLPAALVAACSRNEESAAPTQSSEPASSRPVTEVASSRPVTEISPEPDAPSLGLEPTQPEGTSVDILGLSLTVPADAVVTEVTDPSGNPARDVTMADAVGLFPRVRVLSVENFGRSLEQETYAQEVLLTAEGVSSYVQRTREEWPGAAEAYAITWRTSVDNEDGSLRELEVLGLWLRLASGGGWILYGTTDNGTLTQDSQVRQTLLSAVIPS